MRFRLGLHLALAALWLAAALFVLLAPQFEVWGKQRWSAGVLALALMGWNLLRAWLAWRMLRQYRDDDGRSTPADY